MKSIRNKTIITLTTAFVLCVFHSNSTAQAILGLAGEGTMLETDLHGFSSESGLAPLLAYSLFFTAPLNKKMAVESKATYDLMPYEYHGFTIEGSLHYKITKRIYPIIRISYHYNSGVLDEGVPFGGAALYGMGVGYELKKDVFIEIVYNRLFEQTIYYYHHDLDKINWWRSYLQSVIRTTFKFGWEL